MLLLVLPAMSFLCFLPGNTLSGLWLSHLSRGEDFGRTRQLAVGEFCPASSPSSRANPIGFMGHSLTHQTTLYFKGRACFSLPKLSLCPLWTCLALELTMRNKGTVSRPVLKQNCVPCPERGLGHPFNPQRLLPTHSSTTLCSELGMSGSGP